MKPRIRTESKVVEWKPLYHWDQTDIHWDKAGITWDAGIAINISEPVISLESVMPNISSKSTIPRIRVD